jgi:hypothetical protein
MKLLTIAVLSLAAVASGSWTKNINYRSPSEHHPFMGIAIHKVVRRNNLKEPFNASQLNFTHGVASGDPYPNSVILVRRTSEKTKPRLNLRSGQDVRRCTMMMLAILLFQELFRSTAMRPRSM